MKSLELEYQDPVLNMVSHIQGEAFKANGNKGLALGRGLSCGGHSATEPIIHELGMMIVPTSSSCFED